MHAQRIVQLTEGSAVTCRKREPAIAIGDERVAERPHNLPVDDAGVAQVAHDVFVVVRERAEVRSGARERGRQTARSRALTWLGVHGARRAESARASARATGCPRGTRSARTAGPTSATRPTCAAVPGSPCVFSPSRAARTGSGGVHGAVVTCICVDCVATTGRRHPLTTTDEHPERGDHYRQGSCPHRPHSPCSLAPCYG